MPGTLKFDVNAEAAKLIAAHPDTMPGDNRALVNVEGRVLFAQKSKDDRWEVHGEARYSTRTGVGLQAGGVISWGQ